MAMLETPSRIWRRIEAVEAHNDDMPSLPSLPALDDSLSLHESDQSDSDSHGPSAFSGLMISPAHSTPTVNLHENTHRALPALTHQEDTHGENTPRFSRIDNAQRLMSSDPQAIVEPELITNLSSVSEDVHGDLSESDGGLGRLTSPASLSDILEESDILEGSRSSIPSPEKVSEMSGCDSGRASISAENDEYSVSIRSQTKLSPKPDFKNVAFRSHSSRNQAAPLLSLSASSASSATSNPTPKSSASGELPRIPRSPSAPPFLSGYFENNAPNQHFQNNTESSLENVLPEDEVQNISLDLSKLPATSLTASDKSNVESPRNIPLPGDSSIELSREAIDFSDSLYDHTAEGMATPHTRRKSFLLSIINSTSRPRMMLPTPHPKTGQANSLHAFAGATPGPRISRQIVPNATPSVKLQRSHPLSQAHTLDPVTPVAGNGSPDGTTNPSGSNVSFISTASSHDLVMHSRANASFDPITGFQGVNRFNAGKLNTYLHGLNRRLQEENEALVAKLKIQQEGNMRLRSKGHEGLEDLREDIGAEYWLQERDLLERQIEGLKAEVEARCDEKDVLKEQLEKEMNDRLRDKDRWKNKMIEVEQGAEGIVKGLEDKLAEAERRNRKFEESEHILEELRQKLDVLKEENSIIKERAEKAERVMEGGRELGGELKAAHENLTLLRNELTNAKFSINDLRRQLLDSNKKRNESEKLANELELQLTHAGKEVEKLSGEVGDAKKWSIRLVDELDKKDRLNRLANEALEVSSSKLVAAEEEMNELRGRVIRLEQKNSNGLSEMIPKEKSDVEIVKYLQSDIEELEKELREAQREIGRLNGLLQQSPARKAIDAAKDTRIKMLEREKDELAEILKKFEKFNTPSRFIQQSGISPIHRQALSIHMRTPKTPGGPLRDMSWLHDTAADVSTSPLLAEVNRLQEALNDANTNIDDKLNKLEVAGLDIVESTRQLEDARSRIRHLEANVVSLERLDKRRLRQLARVFCSHCHRPFDMQELTIDNSQSSEAELRSSSTISENTDVLRSKLRLANIQLESMKKHWDEDNANSKEAERQLNAQIKLTQEQLLQVTEASEGFKDVPMELSKAKGIIGELENQLGAERSRLRSLMIKQADAAKEKDDIVRQLCRTEEDMNGVQSQLKILKKQNAQLETELSENRNIEQRARHLTVTLNENNVIIERLRREGSALANEHSELQKHFASTSEQLHELRRKNDASQVSHDDRRYELDRLVTEIEDLKAAIDQKSIDLKTVQNEKQHITLERSMIKRSVASLEADLRRVRQDAEVFGSDLKSLRAERDRLEAKHREEMSKNERASKESSMTIRLLKEELISQKEKTRQAITQFTAHICQLDNESLEQLKLQHKKECKGLIIQIRYLKEKFTRESSFRADLGYQKDYLLLLLSNEMRILATIAQIRPPRITKSKRRSFKVVGLLVLFVTRIQRVSTAWREQRAAKQTVVDALHEVRKKRAVTS